METDPLSHARTYGYDAWDILNKESDLAYERFGATETKGAD